MGDSVKFHDKEIPILEDYENIAVYAESNLKDMVGTLLIDSNVVMKGMTVTQASSPGMTVLVNIDGTAGYGLAMKSDGSVIKITSNTSGGVTFDAADPASNRIDLLIAKEDVADADQETRYFRVDATTLSSNLVYVKNSKTATFEIVKGTAGSGVAPSMSGYSGYIKLAEVTVRAAATSILTSDIKGASSSSTWTTDTSTVTSYSALSLKAFRDEFDTRINQTVKTDSTVTFGVVTATTGNFTNGYGLVPLGAIIPIAMGMTGVPIDASLMLNGFAKCDGTTAATQGIASPTVTGATPNLNTGVFLRGNTSYNGAGGGANSINIAHTHDIGSHYHGLNSHTHAISNDGTGTTSSEASHTHGSSSMYACIGHGLTDTMNRLYTSTGRGTFTSDFYYQQATWNNTTETKPGTAIAGSTDAGSSHSHTGPSHSHGGATAVANSSSSEYSQPTCSSVLSATQSILPTYINAVYYMRVK